VLVPPPQETLNQSIEKFWACAGESPADNTREARRPPSARETLLTPALSQREKENPGESESKTQEVLFRLTLGEGN